MSRMHMNAKEKKIIVTIVSIIASVIVIIAACGVFLKFSERGQEISSNAQAVFAPVELPNNSKELTAVPEPSVGRADSSDDEHISVDMNGRDIVPASPSESDDATTEENYTTDPNYTENINQVSNIGERFVIPSVGLDVPLGTMNSYDGLIEPTNFTSAFVVTDFSPGWPNSSDGSTVIAMHALDEGGIAPGNFVVGTNNHEERTKSGDTITFNGKNYSISSQKRIGKGLIAYDKEVWESKPNRLVLITCLPNSNDNFVIFAEG